MENVRKLRILRFPRINELFLITVSRGLKKIYKVHNLLIGLWRHGQ